MKAVTAVSSAFLIMLALLVPTVKAAELDLSRLLVLYLCDEGGGSTLKDSSSNGWDAEVTGASWETGVFNQAVRLKGTNSEVKGDIIGSTGDTGEISIMCWFNMAAHSNYNGLVSIANPACDASCCYRLMVNPSKNPFWNAGHHSDKSSANFTFELNKWYHYALVANGEVSQVYVDGVLVEEVPEDFELPKFDEVTLYVGTGEAPGTWTIEDCAFDEIMIWDKALDEGEIKTVMEGFQNFSAVDPHDKAATTWGELKKN